MDVLSPPADFDFAKRFGSASRPLCPPSNPAPQPAAASEAAPLAVPPEPATLLDSGLPRAELESLVLKILLQRGACTGSVISEVACMPRRSSAKRSIAFATSCW